MSSMMMAAQMYGPNDIRYEAVPKPACPPGGFVVRVLAVGLCGSDIRNLTTDSRQGSYPFIYGHEVVGVVDEVATGVSRYHPGERIYIYPEAHCLTCENCRSGHHEQCTDIEHYTDNPGGFAEYIAYSARRVQRGATFRLPEGVDPVLASLAEPLSSTYACAENVNITLGDRVVIIGAGPIGVFLTVLSRMRGARQVILVDINPDRLAKAAAFGADLTIDSSEVNAIDAVRQATGGMGADKVISANPATSAQAEALFMARRAGTVVFFGGVPKGALTPIDSNVIHYHGLWIYGHYGANSMQVQRAFELAISPCFPAADIVTHVLPLSEINRAIKLTRSGEALKVVLVPDSERN